MDFFLPNENVAIECQGLQHFKPIAFFGGEDGLKKTQERDAVKKSLCEERGIKLLYYADYEYEFPYRVIKTEDELLQKLKDNNL